MDKKTLEASDQGHSEDHRRDKPFEPEPRVLDATPPPPVIPPPVYEPPCAGAPGGHGKPEQK
jgi:hypothetical protein